MEYKIMSDNEVSNNKLSDNGETEKKEAAKLSSASSTSTAAKKTTAKPVTTKPSPAKTSEKTKKATNKTATVAVLLASVSIFASIGHYVWLQQQTNAQFMTLSQQNQQAIQQSQAQLKSSLTNEFNRQLQQQHQKTSQSQQNAQKSHLDSDAKIQQLSAQISQLEQQVRLRQPSDWLIHEADYLIRIAARTMWLERDTKAAISLLREADSRLKALKQPKYLPVRALINEDIENLALMPTLNNQQAILTLMALNKQVPNLILAKVNLAQTLDDTKEDFTLSDDIGDWQSNLAKTWQKFLNDFITVRRRAGMVEPLMTPNQQQHLQQNLSLKVQLVQWAASEQKSDIYQQTLLDIQQWLNEFFDMDLLINQKFYQSIEQLKQQTIYYDYPSDLRSLTAIKRLLQETKQGKQPQKIKSDNTKKAAEPKQATEQNIKKETVIEEKPVDEEVSGGQL